MTHHSTAFEIERPVPADDAVTALLPAPPETALGNQPAPAARQKFNFRKMLMTGAAVAALAGAVWYGWDYWTVGRYLVSTDDAYVKADNTTIAPKVSGYLREVKVGDNEHVSAGQVLARIDERDFQVALDQARSDVAAAEAAIVSKQAQLGVQQAVIDAARATVDVDNATVTFAAQENKRYTDLAASGYGSVQNAQQAQSHIAGAKAAIERDTANLASALKQVDLLKAEIAQATAALARARATQSQAELNLGYTSIVAPIDGIVGNRTLRTGQFVQAGTQLMSVVPVAGAYVVANYKETQLTDVREGQGGRYRRRHVPRPHRARPCRQHCAGQRPGIRAAAAGQRHRQFHQGGATHPGQDRARRRQRRIGRAAAGHVGDPHHRDEVPKPARSQAAKSQGTKSQGIAVPSRRPHRGIQTSDQRSRRIVPCPTASRQPRYPHCRARAPDPSAQQSIRTAPASRPGSPCWRP